MWVCGDLACGVLCAATNMRSHKLSSLCHRYDIWNPARNPEESCTVIALSLHCHRTGRFCDRTVIGLSMDRAAKYPEESCTVIALSSACAGGVMEDRQESCTVMEESWRSRRGHALYITSHGKSWKRHGNTRRSHSLSWQSAAIKPEESFTVIAL